MANNQHVNKVVFGNETLIDLTEDTVLAAGLGYGLTAHDASGALITGTLQRKTPDIGFTDGIFQSDLSYGVYSGTLIFETIPIPVPSSGTNHITIKVPNGTTNPSISNDNDWIPITFTVDTNGNSEITEDAFNANGVSF